MLRQQLSERERRARNRALRESESRPPPEPEPVSEEQDEENEHNEEEEENASQGESQEEEQENPRRVSFDDENAQDFQSESEGDEEGQGNNSTKGRRRKSRQITPELLEQMGFVRHGGARQPRMVLQPTITVAPQLPLGKPYSGGSGLKQFEKAFRTIAIHNKWPDVVAAVNLKDNLSGAARVVVSNLEADEDDFDPSVDDIFRALRSEFGGSVAKLDAKARYMKISQRPGESVSNFTTRFQSVRIKAGKNDDEEAAMHFWGALATVGSIPYDSDRFVNVETVARVMRGIDTSAKLRSKRKAENIEEEDVDNNKSASKLAQILKRKQQKRVEQEDSDEDALMVKFSEEDGSEDEKIKAMVRQLNMDGVYRKSRDTAHRAGDPRRLGNNNEQPNDRGRDLAEPRHGERQPGSRLSASCQLCGDISHDVSSCPEICCSNCGENGHIKANCQRDPKCAKCGKANHTTVQCWRDKTCRRCGMRGHVEERCRTILGSRPENRQPARPTWQDSRQGVRDDRTCFKCGRTGHIARDCLSDQHRSSPATGSNRFEVGQSRDRMNRKDDRHEIRVPVKDERRQRRDGDEQDGRQPGDKQEN